ncbi:MAG: YggS family pyridoxal phosphate-dependent enzyme [Planctomycetota bacterium]
MNATRHDGHAQLKDDYHRVNDAIAAAAARAGKRREDVVLIAVTKYASMDQIRHIVELGQADLGENRVQQLTQRVPQLNEFLSRKKTLAGAAARDDDATPDKVRWHMIGQLQRNKVKQVAPHVDLIHSVDSLRLAEELHNYASRMDIIIDILVQVNASGETTKAGIAPPAVTHLIESIDTMMHLRPRGLMTMAPLSDDPQDARPTFARTAEIFADVKSEGVGGDAFNVLSMGMSNDFEVAIEEGANVVRVGRALFGETES